MKPLISSIEIAQNTTNYDFNKMMEDFEIERRKGDKNKKNLNKWKNESKNYLKKIELMKEKREGVYQDKMNTILSKMRDKDKLIQSRLTKNKKEKELKRIKSFDNMIPTRSRAQLAKDNYERKIKQDEYLRRLNAKRVFEKCNFYYIININKY